MNYETSLEIELALFWHFFNYRINIVVPNVSWGLGVHECDLLSVTQSGYATEVEIKVSKSDLIKDKEKWHGHKNRKIKYLYFAIPEKLNKDEILAHIPEKAGILVIDKRGRIKTIRSAILNIEARALTEAEMFHLARLGAMRIPGLKEKVFDLKEYVRKLKLDIKEGTKIN